MRPTPRKDLIQRRGRRGRPPTAGRIVAALLFLGVGTAVPAVAAHDHWIFAAIGFGVVALTTIGCFSLAEMEDIEFEAAVVRSKTDERAAV